MWKGRFVFGVWERGLVEPAVFAHVVEFVEDFGLFHLVFDLVGGEVGGEGLGAVCDGVGGEADDGCAEAEVALGDFVEGVAGFVVEGHVLVEAGPEDEGRNAAGEKACVVGTEGDAGVVGDAVCAEAGEEGLDGGEGGGEVGAAEGHPAFGSVRAGVGDEDGIVGGHFGLVGAGEGLGAEEAFLFSAEEGEAEGAAGGASGGGDGLGDGDDGGCAGSVVLRAGAGVPGVEVTADEDDFLGEVAAGEIGDDVVDGDVLADGVDEAEFDSDWAFFQEATEEEGIFLADDGGGEGEDCAVPGTADGDGVLDGAGAGEDGERAEVGEELVVLVDGAFGGGFAGVVAVGVDEDDGALDVGGFGSDGVGGVEVGEVEDGATDAGLGGGGAPAFGFEMEALDVGLEDVGGGELCGLPGGGDGPGFLVDVFEAETGELGDGPVDGLDVVGGAGEAGADAVGELAVVLIGLAVEEEASGEVVEGGGSFRGEGGGGGRWQCGRSLGGEGEGESEYGGQCGGEGTRGHGRSSCRSCTAWAGVEATWRRERLVDLRKPEETAWSRKARRWS